MTESNLVLFLIASLLVIITPGQDMILVMSRSLVQGSTAGVATAAGVSSGLLIHTVLAALGLGAILQASELLFFTLKLCGAAYLIYLGVKLLCTRSTEIEILATSRSKKSLVGCTYKEHSQIYQILRLPYFTLHSYPNSFQQEYSIQLFIS